MKITMNEYQFYNDSFPESQSTVYYKNEEIKKSTKPVWLASLITALIVSLVFTIIFVVLFYTKSPTKILYSNPEQSNHYQNNGNNYTGFPIAEVSQKCTPSTVYVSSTGIIGGFFAQQISLGEGSGIIVSDDGYIITSTSIVNSGTDITVTLNDGQEIPAMIVGTDQKTDIAVLKIEAEGLVPAVLGDSSTLSIGDPVLAIGNPLGPKIMNTSSYGIISGINNNISIQNGVTMNLIQTDANLSSGNAGGGLFNANGEIIGILIANITSDTGISFSVPVNDVKPLLSSFLNIATPENSNSDTPMIGITGTDETYGVVVETVSENYPAAKAGIKINDVIIKVDGIAINSVAKINEIRMQHKRGDTMTVTVFRDGETLDIPVVLE